MDIVFQHNPLKSKECQGSVVSLKAVKNIIAPYKPTYEDVDRWYKNGNGFLQNLSEDEKNFYLSKEEGLPLGL